jgi:flagellar biosynthesis chaperone FliJ
MDKFLSQIEATISKNKEALGLDSNDWFMKRDALFEQDEEIALFLKDKQSTEYELTK